MEIKILGAFIMLSLFSCDLNGGQEYNLSQDSVQQLIFGIDYAECGGDCALLFKIEGKKLFEDDNVKYLPPLEEKIPFKTEPLPSNKYQIAKGLLESFPEELWNSDPAIIGQPNAFDQGGISIELSKNGITKRWYIDTIEEQQPDYLVPYTRKIKEVITKLLE